METTTSDKSSGCFPPPFVGRENERAQLARFYSQRANVLITGEQGVGKSALLQHIRTDTAFHLSRHSTALREIFDSLEQELGLPTDHLPLIQRKQTVLRSIAKSRTPVVFDGVEWTTPKLSSFLENVSERVPVWICARSEHPWDIGHFWPTLVRFARVELRPFRMSETKSVVLATVACGRLPSETLEIVGWLHRISGGNPARLSNLLNRLANGHYDVRNPRSLRLLKLDCEIEDILSARSQIEHSRHS